MIIRVDSFCGLARNQDWHKFLEATAPDLFKELIGFLRTATGCRSVKAKMMAIYQKLYQRGKGNDFENLMRRRFPYIIKSDDSPPKPPPKPVAKKVITKKVVTEEELNKHGVFRIYKPNILTFPHKLIIVDKDHTSLMAKVKDFLRDKIEIDYLIIEDRAYIEYLLNKYKDAEDKLDVRSLEISQYRMREMQK